MWFAGVGAARALDYASTLNLRRRGLDEILLTNSVVDNHPLFGGIEAAATAASIGVAFPFHRIGHHLGFRRFFFSPIRGVASIAAPDLFLQTPQSHLTA